MKFFIALEVEAIEYIKDQSRKQTFLLTTLVRVKFYGELKINNVLV